MREQARIAQTPAMVSRPGKTAAADTTTPLRVAAVVRKEAVVRTDDCVRPSQAPAHAHAHS